MMVPIIICDIDANLSIFNHKALIQVISLSFGFLSVQQKMNEVRWYR